MSKCPRPGEKCQEYSCGANDAELCKVDIENELWNTLKNVLSDMVTAQSLTNRTVSILNRLVNSKDAVKDYTEGYEEALHDVETAMYHECFEVDHSKDELQKWDSGNWWRYKLFENVMRKLKEGEQNG